MYPTKIENDISSIFAAVTGAPGLDPIPLDVDLIKAGFDLDSLFHDLGLERPSDITTMKRLIEYLKRSDQTIRAHVWEMATKARVRRLLYAFMSIGDVSSEQTNERQRWWLGLATQIVWWHARENATKGQVMVRSGVVGKIIKELLALGVLELEALAADNKETAQMVRLVLKRAGFPESMADDLYRTLVKLSKSITTHYNSRPQQILHDEANKFAITITNLLTDLAGDAQLSPSAVRMWLRTMTGLPITIWSSSSNDFLYKFQSIGVEEDALATLADTFGHAVVDQIFTGLMDVICRSCDPNNPNDQHCVCHFIDMGWQVECPSRPDFASQYR